MSWYSVGAEAADAVAASMITKRRKNFFTDQKRGESATIRFLTPAAASFNYKRSFVQYARGEKMLTSPGTLPDPFVEAGLSLQASFGWWIIDRRILEFKDQQTGEDKKVGPRVLYFADGQRTRKQLLAFEQQMLVNENEDREADGKEPLTLADFNLTSYDITASKAAKAPWNFVAKRPRELSTTDLELVEKVLEVPYSELYSAETDDDGRVTAYTGKFRDLLAEELAPLPLAELTALLRGQAAADTAGSSNNEETTSYSYGDDDEDTVSFKQ